MLSTAAPRATQVVGVAPPPALRDLEQIRDALGLEPGDCVADSLVACGLGPEPAVHEVAACAQRFLEHALEEAVPEIIIFRGRATLRLAVAAGLLERDAREEKTTWIWQPVGVPRDARIFILTGGRHQLWDTIRSVAKVLGVTPRSLPRHPHPRAGAEEELLGVLGSHTGMGRKRLHREGWTRLAGVPLSAAEVRDHLDGRCWVAPFSPMHDWKFIGVDIDRHNGVQELDFEKTLKGATKALEGALVFQSGPSHGAHIYVRVPSDWRYKDAAMIVRAYIALLGYSRKQHKTGAGQLIMAELVEVPSQPLRLPFGRGNKLWDDRRPIDEQLDAFLAYMRGSDFRAFELAKSRVFRELRFEGAWTAAKRQKLETWLSEEELRFVKRSPLPIDDPWAAVINELPPYLATIATTGATSYGTRSRWTRELVRALADLRPREELEHLMLHWVTTRKHSSEDIEHNLSYALRQTQKFIASHYRSLSGVPERVWREVDKAIQTAYATAASSSAGTLHATAQGGTLQCNDLRNTAFFLLRRFYSKKRRALPFSYRYFQRFTGTNTSGRVKIFLVGSGTWLRFGRGALWGRRSEVFVLREDLWLAAPGEPLLYSLPSET